MSPFEKQAVSQIDGLLNGYAQAVEESKAEGKTPDTKFWTSRYFAALERFVPVSHGYLKDLEMPRKLAAIDSHSIGSLFHAVTETLKAVRADYAAGFMRSVAEMVHGDVFSDMLEMAEYLYTSKYPVPATVVAGTVLEGHIRNLCDKNSIARNDANGKAKKVETMNVDLTKAGVYATPTQQQVTALYALRSAAAHGKMQAGEFPSVPGMIAGVRQFLANYPA